MCPTRKSTNSEQRKHGISWYIVYDVLTLCAKPLSFLCFDTLNMSGFFALLAVFHLLIHHLRSIIERWCLGHRGKGNGEYTLEVSYQPPTGWSVVRQEANEKDR